MYISIFYFCYFFSVCCGGCFVGVANDVVKENETKTLYLLQKKKNNHILISSLSCRYFISLYLDMHVNLPTRCKSLYNGKLSFHTLKNVRMTPCFYTSLMYFCFCFRSLSFYARPLLLFFFCKFFTRSSWRANKNIW